MSQREGEGETGKERKTPSGKRGRERAEKYIKRGLDRDKQREKIR
jgi:hypothetical protein